MNRKQRRARKKSKNKGNQSMDPRMEQALAAAMQQQPVAPLSTKQKLEAAQERVAQGTREIEEMKGRYATGYSNLASDVLLKLLEAMPEGGEVNPAALADNSIKIVEALRLGLVEYNEMVLSQAPVPSNVKDAIDKVIQDASDLSAEYDEEIAQKERASQETPPNVTDINAHIGTPNI